MVLLWLDDRGGERRLRLAHDVTVGRLAENDVVLLDPLVSRKHCRIEKRGEGWTIVDLESRFGTYLNDERVQGEKPLVTGDRLRIGNTPVQLLSDEEAAEDEGITGATTTGSGRSDAARTASATARVISAKELAEQVLHYVENPSSDRRATLEAARELVGRVAAAEISLADLQRTKALGQTLATVGNLISMVPDVDAVLRMTLEEAVRVLGADRGFVLLSDDGKLVARVQKNMGPIRGISTSIAEQVVESGEPILTMDAQVDPRFKAADSVMMNAIRAVMCVPLVGADQKAFGAIFVDGRPGNPMFSNDGVGFLKSFAAQASTSIEKAQIAAKHKEEEQNRQRLSSFFSPGVIEDILRGSESEALGGKAREVTVLFTDIRGFTTLLEKLSPAEAVEMLNDYFTVLVDDLLAEDATLDKFTGDGIMAFFNSPKEQPDHALRAVRASLRMQSRMPALLARWKVEKRSFADATASLATGIGIHTGEAVVGRIGSMKKKDYTAIGDTVNVAARVQGVAAGGETLITKATLERLGNSVRVEPVEAVALKGKTQAVEIFRVLGI